jgi:hypothetical protein
MAAVAGNLTTTGPRRDAYHRTTRREENSLRMRCAGWTGPIFLAYGGTQAMIAVKGRFWDQCGGNGALLSLAL